MGRPRNDPDRTLASAKTVPFRMFKDELDEFDTALFEAGKLKRQTVLMALVREYMAGRIHVDKDSAVTYPHAAGADDESAGTDDESAGTDD